MFSNAPHSRPSSPLSRSISLSSCFLRSLIELYILTSMTVIKANLMKSPFQQAAPAPALSPLTQRPPLCECFLWPQLLHEMSGGSGITAQNICYITIARSESVLRCDFYPVPAGVACERGRGRQFENTSGVDSVDRTWFCDWQWMSVCGLDVHKQISNCIILGSRAGIWAQVQSFWTCLSSACA